MGETVVCLLELLITGAAGEWPPSCRLTHMKGCCLCGNPEIYAHENRSTRKDEATKKWGFCRHCWIELKKQRGQTDPEIALRYAVFLRYVIVGGMNRGWGDHDVEPTIQPRA